MPSYLDYLYGQEDFLSPSVDPMPEDYLSYYEEVPPVNYYTSPRELGPARPLQPMPPPVNNYTAPRQLGPARPLQPMPGNAQPAGPSTNPGGTNYLTTPRQLGRQRQLQPMPQNAQAAPAFGRRGIYGRMRGEQQARFTDPRTAGGGQRPLSPAPEQAAPAPKPSGPSTNPGGTNFGVKSRRGF